MPLCLLEGRWVLGCGWPVASLSLHVMLTKCLKASFRPGLGKPVAVGTAVVRAIFGALCVGPHSSLCILDCRPSRSDLCQVGGGFGTGWSFTAWVVPVLTSAASEAISSRSGVKDLPDVTLYLQ